MTEPSAWAKEQASQIIESYYVEEVALALDAAWRAASAATLRRLSDAGPTWSPDVTLFLKRHGQPPAPGGDLTMGDSDTANTDERSPLRCLNAGCGARPTPSTARESWVNLDARPLPGVDVVRDLRRGLPFGDGVFDHVRLDNVLEHFESADAIFLINELCRVLRDWGTATVIVPDGRSQGAWQDPTHRSAWVPRSCLYWNQVQTPYGGLAVGITANFIAERVILTGDRDGEEFVEFRLRKHPWPPPPPAAAANGEGAGR